MHLHSIHNQDSLRCSPLKPGEDAVVVELLEDELLERPFGHIFGESSSNIDILM